MSKFYRSALLCTLVALWSLACHAQPRAGNVVFQTSFDEAEPLKKWQGIEPTRVHLETGNGGKQGLAITSPATADSSIRVQISLPVEHLRGARVRCEAMVKAQDVVEPPKPYNGIKVMLHHVSPAGERWDQQNSVFGTFDWRKVSFSTTVPADTSKAELILGIEATSGKAWFDDVKVVVLAGPRQRPAQAPTGPIYKGHALPRLRGMMISPNISEASLRLLAGQWKANHIRWQLLWNGFPHSPADNGDLAAYDIWLESALQQVDKLLPVCRELGVLVLIDLHTPPGGRNAAQEMPLFHEKRFQDKFIEIWDKIARRYKGNPNVWGYDLVNEPVEGTVGEGLMNWQALATAAAQRVRTIDAERTIVIEPAPWGGPQALENLQPLPVKNVVYSVHMYEPHVFTHQGVHNNAMGFSYPGVINGKNWEKETLRLTLKNVVDWQRDYGVHIYIGEFSAIRWAPENSAYNYLRDVIDIFEENQWDWAYHAFREWHGWSVEHGTDAKDEKPSANATDREQLMRSWFEKNVRLPLAAN